MDMGVLQGVRMREKGEARGQVVTVTTEPS